MANPPRRFASIVVAAGLGSRAGDGEPKQYRRISGKTVLWHAVSALSAHGLADDICVVIAAGAEARARDALADLQGRVRLVTGGSTRRHSVLNGLEAMTEFRAGGPVLIHDAARPFLPAAVIDRLLDALDAVSTGAVPVLPVIDSIVLTDGKQAPSPVDRHTLWRVQTPQAFELHLILAAHRDWPLDRDASDDATVFTAAGHRLTLVEGDELLAKLTYPADFALMSAGYSTPIVRVGQGYDVHRLVAGRTLWLGGIRIDHDRGLDGHSDADVALHAITDAVLGAIGEGDIGSHFPPSDPVWAGVRSDRFLAHAVGLARSAGFAIANIDLTIICEAPKIGPHRDAMRESIATICAIDVQSVSVKATTTEGLGFTGRGEAIAAQAVILIVKPV